MRTGRRAYPQPVLIALGLALLAYALVWSLSQSKLIYTDEVIFARDMARIAQGDWSGSGIPHPPLYTSLGGLAVKLFGANLPAMRLAGALSFGLTLALIPLACAALLPESSARASIIALGLYVIHPLAIQGSLLLDIDNTIFTPAMLLFVTLLALSDDWPFWRRVLALALSFGLMLWTKLLPGALVVTAAALAVTVWRRRNWASTALGLALGGLLFGGSLLLVAQAIGFPLAKFQITFNRVAAPASGGSGKLVTRLVMGGGITLVWLAIPFVLLWLAALAARLRRFFRTWRAELIDIPFVAGLGGLLLFSAGNELPMGFPRYHYPLLVLMVIPVGGLLAAWGAGMSYRLSAIGYQAAGPLIPDPQRVEGALTPDPGDWRERRPLLWLGVAALLYAIYALLTYPDPLLPQYLLTFETASMAQRLRFAAQLQAVTLLVPLAALTGGLWLAWRRWRAALIGAGAVFCVIGWLVLLAAQTRAPYATSYEYGRAGGADVARLIAERTAAADPLIAPLEVVYAARRPGDFVLAYVCPACAAADWLRRFESQPPAAYVLTTKEDGRYVQVTREPQVLALLERCFAPPERIGSYLVYFRDAPQCR